jgi:glycosyltransferase involved in cell wall biosynthesis
LKYEKDFFLRLLIRRWYIFLRMQKRVAPRLPFIITVSNVSKEDIAKDFNVPFEKIFVVHNGVDIEKFRPIPSILPDPYRLVATASADVPLKGLNYLIKALALVKKSYPEVSLRVIGRPKQGGTTERLIQSLGLEESTSFVSGICDEELVREYAKASIAVIPSLYEGFGFPAAEAMSCGKAIVSTTGGALPELVGNAGLLVPPGDPKQLANAICYLLANPKLQREFGKKARARILEKFNWRLAAIKTVEVYKKAIEHHVNC